VQAKFKNKYQKLIKSAYEKHMHKLHTQAHF